MNDVKNWINKNPKTATNIGLGVTGLVASSFLPSLLFWGGLIAGGVGYVASDNFRAKVDGAHAGLVGKVREWSR